jgi:hypothetical protein
VEALCSDCVNGYLGNDGVFCRIFMEVIWNERVAGDCPYFEH